MRPLDIVLSLLLYTTLSAAWPWPPTVQNINNALARRQNDDDNNSSAESTRAAPSKTADASTASKTASRAAKTTDNDSASASETSKPSKTSDSDGKDSKSTKKGSAKTTSISVDPAGSPGVVTMIEPEQTSTTYIKIGEHITFKWNYTGLLIKPKKIDVIATNSDASTWTLAQNASMEPTGTVVWDTSDATPSLNMEKYGFIVYDAELGPSATPESGHLSPMVNPYQFALYSPRSDQGSGKKFCVTCSSAVMAADRQSLKVLALVATLTVLSFTYFTCGFFGL